MPKMLDGQSFVFIACDKAKQEILMNVSRSTSMVKFFLFIHIWSLGWVNLEQAIFVYDFRISSSNSNPSPHARGTPPKSPLGESLYENQ